MKTLRFTKPYFGLVIMTIWALMMSLSVHASTLTTGWVHNPQHPPVAVRLMLTGEKNEANKTVEGLLEVKLDKDWKTYWRSPYEGVPRHLSIGSYQVTSIVWIGIGPYLNVMNS